MDAPNPSATPTFASRTPLHIGAIGLTVRDLERLTSFYRDVLGLAVVDRAKDATRSAPAACRLFTSSTGPTPNPTTRAAPDSTTPPS
jgi:catechol 2,3-dioxygenase